MLNSEILNVITEDFPIELKSKQIKIYILAFFEKKIYIKEMQNELFA